MKQIIEVKGQEYKDFEIVDGVEEFSVCSSSGKLASKGICSKTYTEYFVEGTEPEKCTHHKNKKDKKKKDDGEVTTDENGEIVTNADSETAAGSDETSTNSETEASEPEANAETAVVE